MKNNSFISILMLVFAITLLSCEKDLVEEQLLPKKSEVTLKMATVNENGEVTNYLVTPQSLENSSTTVAFRGNNQSASGMYTSAASGRDYIFSAISNNGGVHGQMLIKSNNAGDVHLETICVSTINDEAVYAGLVTAAYPPIGFLEENFIVFFNVKDNGEGNNAPPDQHSQQLFYYYDWFNFYATAEEFLLDVPCSAQFGNPNFLYFVDVASGQIQVK